MKELLLSLITGCILLNGVSAQQRRIYLAPDDHTDYMWSADEAGYREAFLQTLDYYISLNEATGNLKYPFRSKWNCDGSLWVYEYQQNRSREQFMKLMDQVRQGKITVPLNTVPGLMGMAPLELSIRDMYYAGTLERKFDLDLDLVINMEDQVLPLGLSSVWAGSGARYSWRGVCNCATRVKGLGTRPNEIYWYTGIDGRKILMKWYSLTGDNMGPGGYAEARDPYKAVVLCNGLMDSKRYPYRIAGAFGKGWDDLKTTTREFIDVAEAYADSAYQVIVSNEIDFFRDFEDLYGKELPSESVSYGSTEWGNSLASLAAVSARMKRSVEKLRAAEAMYTLVTLKDSSFGRGLEEMREKAWISGGLYFDHDWTADGTIITKKQRADWARKMAGQFSSYVDTLYDMSASRLGELIVMPKKTGELFFVFNPLGWTRTDYCDYPCRRKPGIKVVDMTDGREVPFQFISKNETDYLRIVATDIPSLGYKTFEIKQSGVMSSFEETVSANDSTIENDRYRIVFSRQGVITSLKEKSDISHEWIKPADQLYVNDLGSGKGSSGPSLRIENRGPVSVTLVSESYKPLKHRSEITLFSFNDRIELENHILQNFGAEPVTYGYSFDIADPEIYHEEAGAVLKVKQQSEGGHYADSICRLDWVVMNHFADMCGDNTGVTLSNMDAFLMKTGNSTIEHLDSETPSIKVLAGGQIDAPGLGILNQDGDSHFVNSLALRTYSRAFDPSESMRFSLEHQNPLISGRVTGKTGYSCGSFSLLGVSSPEVLVWAVKPAEDGPGQGIILRIWNLSDKDEECVIQACSEITRCFAASHIETDISEIKPDHGVMKLNIGHNRIETYRIFVRE